MATANTYDDLKRLIGEKKVVLAHHCGDPACEDHIKADLQGVTTRCRPLGQDQPDKGAVCVRCGKPAQYKILFSKNY